MNSRLNISELVNTGDIYAIDDKIMDLKYSIASCFDLMNTNHRPQIEKMQYQLAILEDVKTRILNHTKPGSYTFKFCIVINYYIDRQSPVFF